MMADTESQLGFCQPANVCVAEPSLLSPPAFSDSGATESPTEEKKPVKKRKSWGQELPVPKTNLPPRKRAKTDDEKEQRRIERVLRNRQAAQSSRERKRLEVEKLEHERDLINQQNQLLRQRLLQVEEDRFKLRQEVMEMRVLLGKTPGELTPSASPSPLLSAEMFNDKAIKQELSDLALFPDADAQPAVDPREITPEAPTPAPLELEAAPETTSPDLTQHPAAMLCVSDLQCQSAEASRPASNFLRPPSAVTPWHPPPALATQLLFQTIHLSVYSAVLSPLCQLLASLKKGSPLRTSTITPTLFSLIVWLISTPRSPLPARPSPTSAPTTSTTSTPSTFSPSTTRSSTFRTSLLRRFLACSPALARPLRDATARALHEKARYALRETSEDTCAPVGRTVGGGTGLVGGSTPKSDVWRLMTMALVIDQFLQQRAKKAESQAI